MDQRKLHIVLGAMLASLIGVVLTFSTLHSHHNLDLHNSSEFADTGHCISADTTLCPICAHLVQSEDVTTSTSAVSFTIVNSVTEFTATETSTYFYFPNKGRSPPILG